MTAEESKLIDVRSEQIRIVLAAVPRSLATVLAASTILSVTL